MESYSRLRWALLAIFYASILAVTLIVTPITVLLRPAIITFGIFLIVMLNGRVRYGLVNTLVFFIITVIVSLTFEALSIRTGFPFGYYNYVNMLGPRLFSVPLIIMFAYFAMGYLSWMLSNVLVGVYGKRLIGRDIFLVPLVATFIMVMWDLSIDPISSILYKYWVWAEQGSYFGVPISNYFGWSLVVFIFFQIFALYISRRDTGANRKLNRWFWLEIPVLYSTQAVMGILNPISNPSPVVIGTSLVTVFTMLFVSLLAVIIIGKQQK